MGQSTWGQLSHNQHAVLDPPLPGRLCPLSSPAGALCAPGDPCRALCPCRDPCRALCSSGGSLQAVRSGRGSEAVQSLEIDWPAMQSPENGLANMFIVHVCTLLSSIAPLIKSIKFYCQSTETY